METAPKMHGGPGAENTEATGDHHNAGAVSPAGAASTISLNATASLGGLKANTDEAIAFLQRFAPEGPWALTAIVPDGKTFTQTFWPRTLEAMRTWIEAAQGQRNIYFHVNPVSHELNKKAEKTDMEALAWLHVDMDPRPGEDPASEKDYALGKLRAANPAPTVIIDSGGGVQAFWRLRDPAPTQGLLGRCEELEAYNVQLERLFNADACHNIDRVMRLPGTINIPNAKKLKKGRVKALAQVLSFTDADYPLSMFTAAPSIQSSSDGGLSTRPRLVISGNVPRLTDPSDLDQWQVPDHVKMLIVQGNDPDDATKYASRSAVLFRVCCEMVRCGVPDEVIYSVITDQDFGIAVSVLDKPRPEKYALRQIEQAKEFAINPWLQKLNEKHFVIGDIGGKCRVMSEVFDPALRRSKFTRQSFEDFRNRYLGQKIEVGTDKNGLPAFKKVGHWWLENEKRREYDTLIFAPGQEVEGAYNMWKGFTCEPRPGDCSLFLTHVRDNICCGDDERYSFVLNWMARAVQQPGRQGEVAIVLRGKRGTGKSLFAKTFGGLFGRHFMQVSDPKHLVGAFNAHLRDCVVLFGDEAFYAGEKKHESVLKTIVTEEFLTIEAKGIDAEVAPNFLHIILASNSEWVVPAGSEERRFLVLDVADTRIQDTAYFGPLVQQMQAGGNAALLYLLLNHDIAGWNHRKVPQTDALRDQKLLSADPLLATLVQLAESGRLPREYDQDHEHPGPAWLTAQGFALMLEGAHSRPNHGLLVRIGRFLAKYAPANEPCRRTKVPIYGDATGCAKRADVVYRQLLPLDQLRRRLSEYKHDWPLTDASGRPVQWAEPFRLSHDIPF